MKDILVKKVSCAKFRRKMLAACSQWIFRESGYQHCLKINLDRPNTVVKARELYIIRRKDKNNK